MRLPHVMTCRLTEPFHRTRARATVTREPAVSGRARAGERQIIMYSEDTEVTLFS